MRYRPPYPEYEKGQMYDPFKLGAYRRNRASGRPTGAGSQFLAGAGEELGKEFSWLHGGRPLTMQEMQPLMATKGGHDPRMGTIGGMPTLGQGPTAGPMGYTASGPLTGWNRDPGVGYQAPSGFTTTIPTQSGDKAVTFPYSEVGPTPAAMKDVGTLAQLPYDLMDQYKRIADQGIYGPAGMHQIVQAGIAPAIERTKGMTKEALTAARQTRMQTVNQGARMLADKLGGQFASQPGLAMKLMGDQIIAPTLAKEMEMSMDLKVNETNMLNALDGAIADLIKENQSSKAMGLAGVQDIMGFLQQRTAERWWDLSMENKFGWSPERTNAAGLLASAWMARLGQEYNLTNMQMQAMWQNWLDAQAYERGEYGIGSKRITSGEGGG